VVESLKVLLQAHQLFSHVDAQLKLQHDFYSFIYHLSPIDLTTRKYCDNSRLVRLYNLKFGGGFGIQSARWAVILGTTKFKATNDIMTEARPI
jgi:hypothetical protein